MNFIAITGIETHSLFTLPCSFTEVKEGKFMELFKSKDWLHPTMTKVLNNYQSYSKYSYYITYVLLKLGKPTLGLEKEVEDLQEILDIHAKCAPFNVLIPVIHTQLLREKNNFKISKTAYQVLALAGEIQAPLHQINNYFTIEEQPEILKFLLDHGLDVNATCDFHYIYKPLSNMVDYEVEEYTPIYFANHLTAPILLSHGAIIDFVPEYQLIDEYVDLMKHCCYQNNNNIDFVEEMIDWLLAIHPQSRDRYNETYSYVNEDSDTDIDFNDD
jgi:hypothetical protein